MLIIRDAQLTGNWAQRSFFITAIARVTAGLRWPVKVLLLISFPLETCPTIPGVLNGPTSRYTARHADPNHQGEPIAKSHVDKVPSLDIELGILER